MSCHARSGNGNWRWVSSYLHLVIMDILETRLFLGMAIYKRAAGLWTGFRALVRRRPRSFTRNSRRCGRSNCTTAEEQ
jgi:hypothetical protein